jgi:hypothetical protein
MDRLQQAPIKGFPGVATALEQRSVEYDRITPSKMTGLGYDVYGTAAVQRLCQATLHCVETDLYPLRCDSVIRVLRELRPIGVRPAARAFAQLCPLARFPRHHASSLKRLFAACSAVCHVTAQQSLALREPSCAFHV